jgi:type IV pilus assembly protein PilA
MYRDQDGFTLIELLVVILIIGILTAIAVPAFLGQRARSHDAAAKTFVRHAVTSMETYWIDNRTYVGATAVLLQNIDPSLRPGNGITLTLPTVPTATGYAVRVTSKSTNTFTITRTAVGATAGAFVRTCSRGTTKGSCTTRLTW